jgi:uncharacterized SAM-binding protein YcdF (DUF218 family)
MDALPSQERWDEIARYLDVHTGAAPADAAFILGTRFPDPAHLAAQFFRQGLISHVIATGGINRQTGRVESHQHREILLESGVQLDRVLVEAASTTTIENVRFSLPLIDRIRPVERPPTLLVIAKWYHSRRAVMTLKRHLPRGTRYHVATYELPGLTRETWHMTPQGRETVLSNWPKIPRYLAQGHLEDIQVSSSGCE